MFTIGSGGAQTLRVRQFTGSGAAGFNATTGVSLSGSVTDTTAANLNKGTIGAVSSVTGSVSCGNQTRGTSTVRVTGSSADGSIDISTSGFRVACNNGSSGVFVGITSVATINGVGALEFITIGVASIQVAHEPVGGAKLPSTWRRARSGRR